MKSKKPFLIICAAAVTLALALPFMGVFSFAAESTASVSLSTTTSGIYSYTFSPAGMSVITQDVSQYNRPVSVSLPLGVVITVSCSSGSDYKVKYGNTVLSADPGNPTIIDPPYDLVFTPGTANTTYSYFILNNPPDPLAPVSDGMDTMISVFGDVIDYIINTPDVAIFVAISVASCAIIPMGIILIKKLIKGY